MMRRLIGRGMQAIAVATSVMLLITSCVMPPPPASSLHEALLQDTGYQLGKETTNGGVERAECAAESRYDGSAGPVLVLVCVAPHNGEEGRIRYRVSYTPPEAGHRIWKIDASIPGATYQQLDILEQLTGKYGPGRKIEATKTWHWNLEAAHLELREDQYGVHFMLWDRSLRQS
ncbi:hypothetical protein [Sneathiella sp.]|uniref:hypothetical protein n=1 Tax=Sneathiella sp. TaxID=1964365 RepID=UPI002619F2DA|nr:hypothetical protein [Sneathiella sp.]MDF2368681.1 hypothetical protein [Sneathiella sp.]